MKPILSLFLLLQTVGFFASQKENPNTNRQFDITFYKAFVTSNSGVGDDWVFSLSIDNRVIELGESIRIAPEERSPLKIVAQAIEEDPKYSDSNSNSLNLSYSDLIAIEKDRFEIEVIVEENGGKNKGSLARIKFWVMVEQVFE